MLSTFSLFAQVLGLINRDVFEDLAARLGLDKGNKGFQNWHQFVSMLFAQLADSTSLREINLGLGSASGKLRHLGLTPRRAAPPCLRQCPKKLLKLPGGDGSGHGDALRGEAV